MLAPVTHILPLTTIQRERLLPVRGLVQARLGQRVSATDVVAEGRWAREHTLVDVARKLGVSSAAADRLIRLKIGDDVPANALIAASGGMFPREVRAPREGRVLAVGGGQILFEIGEVNVQVRAGMPGVVTQIVPERGVQIQTAGALIQGVWGNGRIEMGLMINLMDSPEMVLETGRLDMSLRGSVLLAGHCPNAETLQAAAELPVRGLILSSMHPAAIATALQMRYPILVTDGFGRLPMNASAYRLLSTNAKRDVTVNAELFDRYSGARPEAIIPLPITQEPPIAEDLAAFESGQVVRLRAEPRRGAIASIVKIHTGLQTLPSGLRAPCADVRLEGGELALVPLANLEVVG
ncbi:MAG: hypothetical protein HFACDABA_02780 [Anaerolineales bacterium]|nr:hypothetical protein [Anaerolineales bacterium]